jgi:hypothetical protein
MQFLSGIWISCTPAVFQYTGRTRNPEAERRNGIFKESPFSGLSCLYMEYFIIGEQDQTSAKMNEKDLHFL